MKLDRENTAVNEFMLESQMLPKLVEQLSEVGELVNSLDGSFKELEYMLVQLDDVCDEMQRKKNIVEHEYQLTKYQQRKNIELEQSKGTVLCVNSVIFP
jgi:dysbindin